MAVSAGDPVSQSDRLFGDAIRLARYLCSITWYDKVAISTDKLKDISRTSCSVLKEMGPGIQWIQSYVTGDKIFCVYKAESAELLKEHAKRGGFPITRVYEVATVISPATANWNRGRGMGVHMARAYPGVRLRPQLPSLLVLIFAFLPSAFPTD